VPQSAVSPLPHCWRERMEVRVQNRKRTVQPIETVSLSKIGPLTQTLCAPVKTGKVQ
jgi:hypothetical protein